MPSTQAPFSPSAFVRETGGSYARELGIDLSGGEPAEIQKWLLAAVLFGAPISVGTAVKTYREFERAGLVRFDRIRQAGWHALVRTLGRGGYARYDFKTATKLIEVADRLSLDYGDDANALHLAAADETDLVRRIRQLGKGIGEVTAGIFLRELRGVWSKAQPLPSALAVLAAGTLGLVDAGTLDKAEVRQALMTLWREDGMTPETFPEFETALLRHGATLRRKRTPKPP